MDGSNYIKVFTGNFIIVQRIIADLENQAINAVVKDETESGRLAGFGAPIQGQQEVYVHKDELEKAKSIIDNTTKELA